MGLWEHGCIYELSVHYAVSQEAVRHELGRKDVLLLSAGHKPCITNQAAPKLTVTATGCRLAPKPETSRT
jgi:hypothetical protein